MKKRIITSLGLMMVAAVGVVMATMQPVSAVDQPIYDIDHPMNQIIKPASGSGLGAAALVDSQDAVTPRSLPCIGDGTTGGRVRMIYAYKQGTTNRLNSLRPYFLNIAKRVNGVIYQSTSIPVSPQKLRFVTNASCELTITALQLTGGVTGVSSDFSEIVNQARAAGFNSPDRKYLIQLDMQPAAGGICGLARGDNAPDASPSQNNTNNYGYAGYAIVGPGCWNSAEAHEVIHLLGAVHNTAPRSSGAGHCNDDHEIMCYADGGPTSNLQVICPVENNWFMDCGKNDYYDNDPTRARSDWLASHWNIAYSRYLTNTPPIIHP